MRIPTHAAWVLLVSNLAVGSIAGAQELPSLLCASREVMECSQPDGCAEVPLASAGVPSFVRLDLVAETVTVPGQELRSVIESLSEVDGKIILHGTDPGVPDVRDGSAWTITISEQTGDMVATASGEGFAYLIFGVCLVETD